MWLISLFAVVFCSYFLAKMTTNFVSIYVEGGTAPPSVKVSSDRFSLDNRSTGKLEDYVKVSDRNVFDSRDIQVVLEEKGKEEEAEVNPTGEAVVTTLGIKLISTFSVGAGTDGRSTCIISKGKGGTSKRRGKGKSGDQEVYTVDDEKQFAPSTRIVRILYDRVEFVNGKRLEYVELADFSNTVSINRPPERDEPSDKSSRKIKKESQGAEIQKSGDKFIISRSEIDSALTDLDKLYTQIRAVPHFKDGRPNGLKLLSVRGGSIFSKLGLKRGDILQKINGMDLDIKKGLEIFNQLKTESNITIEIERRGRSETLEYEIQ